jgi:chromosome segregation ATPase
MVKPLRASDSLRGASNGPPPRPGDRRDESRDLEADVPPGFDQVPGDLQVMEHLRDENNQLRALCLELEQALQEAAGGGAGTQEGAGERIREFEALVEQKSETIRQLHQHITELESALGEAEVQATEAADRPGAGQQRTANGPVPREEELLALSEQLEHERRQLQEDEQTLMDQMREMEVGMARERAELARQRNDLQRLQAEVRHELERLERNGALQSKIDNLKSKLQDVTARRGARADNASGHGATPAAPVPPSQPPPGIPPKGQGLMGRLFGQGGR